MEAKIKAVYNPSERIWLIYVNGVFAETCSDSELSTVLYEMQEGA